MFSHRIPDVLSFCVQSRMCWFLSVYVDFCLVKSCLPIYFLHKKSSVDKIMDLGCYGKTFDLHLLNAQRHDYGPKPSSLMAHWWRHDGKRSSIASSSHDRLPSYTTRASTSAKFQKAHGKNFWTQKVFRERVNLRSQDIVPHHELWPYMESRVYFGDTTLTIIFRAQ